MSQNARPVVLIADKLAQSTVDALGDSVEVRWVDGPNRPELLAAVVDADRDDRGVDLDRPDPDAGRVVRPGVGDDRVAVLLAPARDDVGEGRVDVDPVALGPTTHGTPLLDIQQKA